ncbi:MAG: calcium/proton exchanger [Planctomycetes bacterium]|nr:calcium/proton exchanger [Planctomycetota bacterium]
MYLKTLLVFVPITIVLKLMQVDDLVLFAVSCLAIVPLADQLAKSTERLAEFLGPTLGGLLNATLGNAPELIIGGLALSKGLANVVKSSVIGSILMNLLLLLGLSMLVGGAKRVRQTFNSSAAGMSAALLTLASIGLIVPALVHHADTSPGAQRPLSLEISVVLFLMYLLSLLFTMFTHRQLFAKAEPQEHADTAPKSEKLKVLGVLLVTAICLAYISEVMTDALDPAIEKLHLNETFAGIIVLGSLGNVAQLIAAVRFAKADKMDLAMGTTVGAATQAALAVAPILVFAGLLLGKPMDLEFSIFEVIALTLSVLVVGQFTRDGESTWMEGAMLVGVYVIFALGFYFIDPPSPSAATPTPAVSSSADGDN